jgi:hypothetical protein
MEKDKLKAWEYEGGVTFDRTGIVDQAVVNGFKKKYRQVN